MAVALILKLLNYLPNFDAIKKNLGILQFSFFFCACLLGVWLSFGARKTVLSFEELTTIEEDRLEPLMRLIFIGAQLRWYFQYFYKEAIFVKVGTVSSKDISSDSYVAMIFGVSSWLSEQILGKKLQKKQSLFDNI